MAETPKVEPERFRAGTTVEWRREDLQADYPASAGWALKYAFVGPAGKWEVTADADGDAFAVTILAVDSNKAAGIYQWQARVTLVDAVHEAGEGTTEVLVNLQEQQAGEDHRFWAVIALEAVEAQLGKKATRDQQNYSIQGVAISHMQVADLWLHRDRLRAEVKREERRLKGARGGRILVRLTGAGAA